MNVTITLTGIDAVKTLTANMRAAAKVLIDRPVSIGPTVSYGIYQEVRRGYMAAGLSGVVDSIGPAIGQALVLGPTAMMQAEDKLARDIQARSMIAAPVRTGALRASIGIFYGQVSAGGGVGRSSSSSRGGAVSRRSRVVGRRIR
jgi:hypothetical protein